MSHWSDPKVMIGAAILRHILPGLGIIYFIILGFTRSDAGWAFLLIAGPIAYLFIGSGIVIIYQALKE